MRGRLALLALVALGVACGPRDQALPTAAPDPPSPVAAERDLSAWREALLYGDPLARRRAAERAGLFGRGDAGALTILFDATDDSDPVVRRWAAEAIEDVADVRDPETADRLEALLRHDDEYVRAVSQRMLHPPMVVPPEAPRRAETRPGSRIDATPAAERREVDPQRAARRKVMRQAAEEIREARRAGAAGLDRLVALLDHEEVNVRIGAIGAIGRLGPQAAAAVPDLLSQLETGPPALRRSLCGALGEIGPAAEPAVPALIRFVGAQDVYLDRNAIRALGRIGPAAAPALPELHERLLDPEAETRADAALAIAQIGDTEVLPALLEMFEQAGRFERKKALAAIRALGPAAAAAAPVLLAARGTARDDHDGGLHRALVAIGLPAAEALELAMGDPDWRLAALARGARVSIEREALRGPPAQ